MKKVWRRNQLIVTALVILIGVAGYLNYTEQSVKETLNWTSDEGKKGEEKTEELTEEEMAEVETTTKEKEGEDGEKNVGEAVLTNAKAGDVFYEIKLDREQARAENKEMLTEILNNKNATEDQKNDAINSIMELADYAEKENEAETLLTAKGFSGAVVSMTKNSVDVVINQSKLSEQEIAQIGDIVTRKTGVSMDKIVISTNK